MSETAAGRTLTINGATVGNPHCVVLVDDPTPELARALGPALERHPLTGVAEVDALYLAGDQHPIADHKPTLRLARPVPQDAAAP